MNILSLLILIAAAIVLYVIITYNNLTTLIESIRNNQKQIKIQSDRRFKMSESLKTNPNCPQLQEEIIRTENKLAYVKQALQDGMERYHATKKSFFANKVVALFKDKIDSLQLDSH